jgi:hypothetical protein
VAPDRVRLLFDTAEIVKAMAGLLRGDRDVAEQASRVCAELCERAARYCENLPGEPAMRACAESCRACADACQLMAAAAA